ADVLPLLKELRSGADRVTEAYQEGVQGLRQQREQVGRELTESLSTLGQQVETTRKELHQAQDEIGRELADFREESVAARQSHVSALASTSLLMTELQSAATQVAASGRLFREAGEQLASQLTAQLNPILNGLREAEVSLTALPVKAEQVTGQLNEAAQVL